MCQRHQLLRRRKRTHTHSQSPNNTAVFTATTAIDRSIECAVSCGCALLLSPYRLHLHCVTLAHHSTHLHSSFFFFAVDELSTSLVSSRFVFALLLLTTALVALLLLPTALLPATPTALVVVALLLLLLTALDADLSKIHQYGAASYVAPNIARTDSRSSTTTSNSGATNGSFSAFLPRIIMNKEFKQRSN